MGETIDQDARWLEIQRMSDAIAYRNAPPSELEAALCGAVWRAREWENRAAIGSQSESTSRLTDRLRELLRSLYGGINDSIYGELDRIDAFGTHSAAASVSPAELVVTCQKCSGKYWVKAENNWWWFEHLYRCPHCQEPFKATGSPSATASTPGTLEPIYLVQGKLHRMCDCLPREGKCRLGCERSLGTTELSRCLIPEIVMDGDFP